MARDCPSGCHRGVAPAAESPSWRPRALWTIVAGVRGWPRLAGHEVDSHGALLRAVCGAPAVRKVSAAVIRSQPSPAGREIAKKPTDNEGTPWKDHPMKAKWT